MRRFVLSLLVSMAAAGQATAQQKGSFELGLFPNVSYFDRSLVMVQGRAGPGARLGYFFNDHLAL